MIARIWKGAVRRDDGDAYAQYMRSTGIPGYKSTPGNVAALMLRRDVDDACEFVMFTLWESMDSIQAFAGAEPDGYQSPKNALGGMLELEVLRFVADGRSNQQIADALFISRKTASVHLSHILAKLGVRTRVEAAAAAHRLGLDS